MEMTRNQIPPYTVAPNEEERLGASCAYDILDSEREPGFDRIAGYRAAFLDKRRAELEIMRDALANGNFALIKGIGHNCKGTGKGYGFPEISRLGLVIERAAKAEDREQLAATIGDFERCVQAASAAEALRTEEISPG